MAAPLGPVTVEMSKSGLTAFNILLDGAMGNMLCLTESWKGLNFFINVGVG